MATERRLRGLGVLAAGLLAGLPASALAAPSWWEPLAFAGQRVASVEVVGGGVVVEVGGSRLVSSDHGRSFRPLAGTEKPSPATGEATPVWVISRGVVLTGPLAGPLRPDAGAPFLGDTAHLIAAPAALPGVVVAVGSDGHVWRRSATGRWATSFILLPQGGFSGTPPVTGLAAFTRPLSAAVYLGIEGYGVLLSTDGGDDWIRADPGLPDHVLGLATDDSTRALYAATDQGLFVHHLQPTPAPPAYVDASLYLRWLGIAGVAVAAALLALLALTRLLPRRE